jgi:hypothetical protein
MVNRVNLGCLNHQGLMTLAELGSPEDIKKGG